MVSMNWLTGMPFSNWTFLKTSSAISGFGCAVDCARAETPARSRLVAMVKSRNKRGWQAEAPARPNFGRPHNNSNPKWKKRRRNTEFRIQNSEDASEERKAGG